MGLGGWVGGRIFVQEPWYVWWLSPWMGGWPYCEEGRAGKGEGRVPQEARGHESLGEESPAQATDDLGDDVGEAFAEGHFSLLISGWVGRWVGGLMWDGGVEDGTYQQDQGGGDDGVVVGATALGPPEEKGKEGRACADGLGPAAEGGEGGAHQCDDQGEQARAHALFLGFVLEWVGGWVGGCMYVNGPRSMPPWHRQCWPCRPPRHGDGGRTEGRSDDGGAQGTWRTHPRG